MTDSKGSILQLKEKQAIVMTDTCDFIKVKRRSDMFVGQQITFNKMDIYQSRKLSLKAVSLIASVFILALCTIFYMQVFNPTAVYAYIDVDINPSLEFSIDRNSEVVSVSTLNQDAASLIRDLDLVGLPVKEAIVKVVEASKTQGFIAVGKENAVLISAAMNNENPNSVDDAKLDTILKELNQMDLGTANNAPDSDKLQSEIIKVTPEARASAVTNKISMGRYILYKKIKEENSEITLDKAKTERVSEMLKEAKAQLKESNMETKSEKKDSTLKNPANGTEKGSGSKDNKNANSSQNNGNSKNSKNKNSDTEKKQKEQIDKDTAQPPKPGGKNNKNIEEKEQKQAQETSASPSTAIAEKEQNNNDTPGSSDQDNMDQGSNGNKPDQSQKPENDNNSGNSNSKNPDNPSGNNNNTNQGKNDNKK